MECVTATLTAQAAAFQGGARDRPAVWSDNSRNAGRAWFESMPPDSFIYRKKAERCEASCKLDLAINFRRWISKKCIWTGCGYTETE